MYQRLFHRTIINLLFIFMLFPFYTASGADTPDSLVQKGDALLQQGEIEQARSEYKKAWDMKSSLEPVLRTKIGVILAQKQRWIEAADEFQKAAELDPKNVIIHFNLANVYASMDMPERGIEEYEKILRIQPGLYWAEFNLSNLYTEMQNYEKAITHAKNALKINSKLAPVHFHLGTLYEAITMIDKALEEYHETISLDPKHAKALYNIGHVHMQKGEFDKAIEFYTKATEVAPNYAEAFINIGAVKMYQKDPEAAIPFFRKALEMNPPDMGKALVNLSVALRDTKKYDDALEYAKKAQELGYKPATTLINSIEKKKSQQKI